MDPVEIFWDLVKSYKIWSVTKIAHNNSLLVLSKLDSSITFYFNPQDITNETVIDLKQKIKEHRDR